MKYTFKHSQAIAFMGKLLIGLIGITWLIIFISILFNIKSSTIEDSVLMFSFITACCIGFISFGLWIMHEHSGIIELTPDEIIQAKGKKVKIMKYSQITSLKHDSKVFKSLILMTVDDKIIINKSIIDYPKMWDILVSKIPDLDLKTNDNLEIKCSYLLIYSVFSFFLLFLLGMQAISIYLYYHGESGLVSTIFLNLIIILFNIFLLFLILKYPKSYIFQKVCIIEKCLMSKSFYNTSHIKKVKYGQKFIKSSSKNGSYMSYFIEILFDGDKSLFIDNKKTDYPIEELINSIKKMYDLKDKFEQISPDNNTDIISKN